MNKDKELHRCERFDLISFDVFDTLVERQVCLPTDVFYVVGLKYFNDEKIAQRFKEDRIAAEYIARKNSKTGEIFFDDIYNELKKILTYANVTDELKQLELNIELNLSRPRKCIIDLCNELFEKGKKVVLISDMYLTSDFLHKMMEKCGVNTAISLFISCECGVNKISGKLFEYVDSVVNVKPEKHLHYGDSYKADFCGAKRVGVIPRFVLKGNLLSRIVRGLYARVRS